MCLPLQNNWISLQYMYSFYIFTAKCCDLGICSHILLKTSFNLPSFLSFFLIKIVLLNHLTNYPLRQDIQVYNNQKNTYENIWKPVCSPLPMFSSNSPTKTVIWSKFNLKSFTVAFKLDKSLILSSGKKVQACVIILSQTSRGFYVSAVKVFWKWCGKRRNYS